MPGVSLSRTRNSKIYNHNPADTENREQNCRSTRVSSPAINQQLPHRNHQPGDGGFSDLAFWRNKYKNNFHGSGGGLDGQSLVELEKHAVYKAEETTNKLNGCMKVAQVISEDASRTLRNLHQQGEQITQTHMSAASMDRALSKAEKILESLGGFFSKAWKPKKSREIKGSVQTRDDTFGVNRTVQTQKPGINPSSWANRRQSCSSAPLSALEKVELEKAKQDDALSELSNILGKLKGIAIDMGSEIDRQNKALDHMQEDVDELTVRVKGANRRTRLLLQR